MVCRAVVTIKRPIVSRAGWEYSAGIILISNAKLFVLIIISRQMRTIKCSQGSGRSSRGGEGPLSGQGKPGKSWSVGGLDGPGGGILMKLLVQGRPQSGLAFSTTLCSSPLPSSP